MYILTSLVIFFLNVYAFNGLNINEISPGVLKENLGSVVKVEDYFHLAIRFNLTALHGQEINEIGELLETTCKLYKDKFTKKNNINKQQCDGVLKDLREFKSSMKKKYEGLVKERKSENEKKILNREPRSFFSNTVLLLGGMYVLNKINNLEHGEQEILQDNYKHLKVMDSTIRFLNLTANKVNEQGQLLNDTINKINNDNILFETLSLKENIFNLVTNYMLLKMEFNSRYSEVSQILEFAYAGFISTQLVRHEEFKKMLLQGKINDNYRHVINLNEIDPIQIQKLCEITVYVEDHIPYVIISLPLISKSTKSHFKLMRLKPIPKLYNNIATFIKLDTNLIVYDTKNIGKYMILENLTKCKPYMEKYYCEHLNNFHDHSENCINEVLKNNQINFSKLTSCKLSAVKVTGINVIQLHAVNSYLIVSTENFTALFQDSTKLHENEVYNIQEGVKIIHSDEPGYLKFKTFSLDFYMQNQTLMKYDDKFDFYSYNYTIPNIDEIQKISPIHFNTLSSKNILSINEVNNLSTEVEKLAEITKDKIALITSSKNDFYFLIILIIVVVVCSILFLILYFKIKSNFRLNNIVQQHLK